MVRIQGYSDDVVYLGYGDFEDEIDACDKEVHFEVVDKNSNGGLRAIARYGERFAVWSIEVERLDECKPIPWPVRIINGDRDYNVLLEVECDPNQVAVTAKSV